MSEEACTMDSLTDPISEELNNSKMRQAKFGAIMAEKSMKTIESLLSEVSYYKDQVIRQRAEIDNYVKAKEREVKNIQEYANRDLIKGLLAILESINSEVLYEPDENGTCVGT